MTRERVLQGLLAVAGLFFVAGIYPLLTSIRGHQQSDYGDQMMLAVYFVLGVFLLLAVRRPATHRSLIAFTGWGTLAHGAVMAVQAAQLKQLRSELLPLTVVAFFLFRVDRVGSAESGSVALWSAVRDVGKWKWPLQAWKNEAPGLPLLLLISPPSMFCPYCRPSGNNPLGREVVSRTFDRRANREPAPVRVPRLSSSWIASGQAVKRPQRRVSESR